MNLVDHLSEKYNVELTSRQGERMNESFICLDITSHFDDLPAFVKKVKLCILVEDLEVNKDDSFFKYMDGFFKSIIKKKDDHSPFWIQDWPETIALICEDGYVIKTTCDEVGWFLMKKYDDSDKVNCSTDDDIWDIRNSEG